MVSCKQLINNNKNMNPHRHRRLLGQIVHFARFIREQIARRAPESPVECPDFSRLHGFSRRFGGFENACLT
jgi:hypothetical protein